MAPLELGSVINILKQYPVSSVAIYTWRKRVNSKQIAHAIIYVTKHQTSNNKLVVRAIDRNVFFGNPELPDTVLNSLPRQIKYVIGNGPHEYKVGINNASREINSRNPITQNQSNHTLFPYRPTPGM